MSTPQPDTNPQPPAQIFPSLIRTIVPMIVGWVIAQLAVHNLQLPSDLVGQVVTWLITAVYYGGVRLLETRLKPVWGWLLGLPKAPTYSAPAAPSDLSPTGAVATVDTHDATVGEPVTVVPVNHDPLDGPTLDDGPAGA